MKSFPALREYSVSPESGSTTRMPQCALRNAGAVAIESIVRRSSDLAPPDRTGRTVARPVAQPTSNEASMGSGSLFETRGICGITLNRGVACQTVRDRQILRCVHIHEEHVRLAEA